jgi:hypothetical protein
VVKARLFLASLEPRTRKNYLRGRRLWKDILGDTSNLPLSTEVATSFVVKALQVGTKFSTLNHTRSWLAAIEKFWTSSNATSGSLLFTKMLTGYQKIAAKAGFERTWPVTWDALGPVLHSGKLVGLPAAAAVLGYAFLLRWSELVSIIEGRSSISTAPKKEGAFILYLDRSKTDVVGRGTSTLFPASVFDEELRPFLLWAIQFIRQVKKEPQSRLVNDPLRSVFGLKARFHGCRHGRASDLAASDLPKKDLQALGRWSSTKAMKIYIHKPAVQLAGI